MTDYLNCDVCRDCFSLDDMHRFFNDKGAILCRVCSNCKLTVIDLLKPSRPIRLRNMKTKRTFAFDSASKARLFLSKYKSKYALWEDYEWIPVTSTDIYTNISSDGLEWMYTDAYIEFRTDLLNKEIQQLERDKLNLHSHSSKKGLILDVNFCGDRVFHDRDYYVWDQKTRSVYAKIENSKIIQLNESHVEWLNIHLRRIWSSKDDKIQVATPEEIKKLNDENYNHHVSLITSQ